MLGQCGTGLGMSVSSLCYRSIRHRQWLGASASLGSRIYWTGRPSNCAQGCDWRRRDTVRPMDSCVPLGWGHKTNRGKARTSSQQLWIDIRGQHSHLRHEQLFRTRDRRRPLSGIPQRQGREPGQVQQQVRHIHCKLIIDEKSCPVLKMCSTIRTGIQIRLQSLSFTKFHCNPVINDIGIT